MIDRFFIGAITGIIALAVRLAIDAQWYVSFPISVGLCLIGYIIADKLGAKNE